MFRIELHNSGGLLETATADTEENAAREAVALIRKVGALVDGDKILIHEVDED